MTDYKKLVEALRMCMEKTCPFCDFYDGNGCKLGGYMKITLDAAAAIEALEVKVKRLEQERDELIGQMPELTETADGWKWKWKPHWVSVEERLPDRNDAYAVGWRYPSGCFYWGKVIFYDGKWQVDEEIPTPDYWMPIEPPQEVQE